MAQQTRGRVLTRRKARLASQCGQLQLQPTFQQINFYEFPGKLLICDIENTIAPRGESVLSSAVLKKFEQAYDAGYRYVILRTNKMLKQKGSLGLNRLDYHVTGDFGQMQNQLESVGFEYVIVCQPLKRFWPPWALGKWPRKPWRATFRGDVGLVQDHVIWIGKTPLGASQIMAVGDKFRFDVLRPLLMGYNTVLVNPIGQDGEGDKFALIRPIERFTLWRLSVKRPR